MLKMQMHLPGEIKLLFASLIYLWHFESWQSFRYLSSAIWPNGLWTSRSYCFGSTIELQIDFPIGFHMSRPE